MSLKTFVKIGSISNLSDARYCSGMMVDILGFNLEEGTLNAVSHDTFQEITNWVAGVKFAGEFSHAHPAEIKLAAANLPLDYIETQSLETLEELTELEIPLIAKIIIEDASELDKLLQKIEFVNDLAALIVIHCDHTSLNQQLESILQKSDSEKLIRSFGLAENNIRQIAEDNTYHGIELLGSPEERPGYKDYGQVMDLLELIEED